MNISWSLIQTFLSCPRKFELSYLEGLSRASADQFNLKLGSAFHAGLEAALRLVVSGVIVNNENLIDAAVAAAVAWVRDDAISGKQVYNKSADAFEPDTKYYQMMAEVRNLVPPLLTYHIPLMGIGRYIPVTKGEVLGYIQADEQIRNADIYGTEELLELALEWKFKFPIGNDNFVTGMIDAVLLDQETGELVIVDWKTRGVFPNDNLALVDGQVHLYAAILNKMGANITRVAMWQFSTKLPSPASISAKNHRPNTGAASYDTTWDYWVATLPPNISPEKYEAEMKPKLKQPEDYQRIVWGVVTDVSTDMMMDNVMATLHAIETMKNNKFGFPAVLGSNACKWCDFLPLCANTFRYGGDATELIERDYVRTER